MKRLLIASACLLCLFTSVPEAQGGFNTIEPARMATPLIQAAEEGDADAVRSLLKNGADPNDSDIFGGTALIRAARNGNIEIAGLLLAHGADVNAPIEGANRTTPLMYAVSNGNTGMVRLLLEHGADVNDRDASWRDAMGQGVGDVEIAGLLLEHGGGFSAGGCGVMYRAACSDQMDMLEVLLAHGGQVCRGSLEGAAHGTGEALGLLLARGMDVNARKADGRTALMTAAELGRADMAGLLLSHGADAGLQDREGRTALMFAVRGKHAEVVRLLSPQD